MLSPKRVKWRKVQKGRLKGKAHRGNTVSFGTYGMLALEPSRITARQIESARIAMTRYIKRGGKIWIRIFPDKPVTKKPAEVRWGRGRGRPRSGSRWSSPGACSSRWTGSRVRSPARRSAWPVTSFRSRPSSWFEERVYESV